MIRLVGSIVVDLDAERGARFACVSSIDFWLRGTIIAALRQQLAVVIVPARARQVEQALALGPALRRIGIGIDEDVAVVERRDQLDRLRQQHAVAEHVARHVAAAGDA